MPKPGTQSFCRVAPFAADCIAAVMALIIYAQSQLPDAALLLLDTILIALILRSAHAALKYQPGSSARKALNLEHDE